MNVLAFTFTGTQSEKVLSNLNISDSIVIESARKSIEEFIEQLITIQPAYILGMGDYSGRDTNQIRLET
jgi:pyrrolidone-carboxylate peptidase